MGALAGSTPPALGPIENTRSGSSHPPGQTDLDAATGLVGRRSEEAPGVRKRSSRGAVCNPGPGIPGWRRVHPVPGTRNGGNRSDEKAERSAAGELIHAYHRHELRALLERLRAGFAQLDAGVVDEFELDDLIHHYKRSAAELWKFCGSTGGQWLQAARALTYLREQGEEPDWWDPGSSRRRPS